MEKNNCSGPKIYNLFPRLAGRMTLWKEHFERIKSLGFDWVYINPFHYPGFSGSLYAPKDYYDFNPLFVDVSSDVPPMKQLEKMIDEAHEMGLKLIMDLVINHTAKDHPFTKVHPDWYKRDKNGEVISPGAWDNGQWIEWGDLGEIDNEGSKDQKKLWNYWKELVLFYQDKGFDGFRADAAYAVPAELWTEIIQTARERNKSVVFFAESLGCRLDQTVALANSGFDFIFNSSKWWNYSDTWLLEQYQKTRTIAPSISFPESHDTARLMLETNDNESLFKQRILFTALFSSGWMIPTGLEYGFRKKVDVCKTTPADWNEERSDFSGFIKKINQIRNKYPLFSEESEINPVRHENDAEIIILKKISGNKKEAALILINKDQTEEHPLHLENLKDLMSFKGNFEIKDISPDKPLKEVSLDSLSIRLKPADIRVIYGKSE